MKSDRSWIGKTAKGGNCGLRNAQLGNLRQLNLLKDFNARNVMEANVMDANGMAVNCNWNLDAKKYNSRTPWLTDKIFCKRFLKPVS